MEFIDSKKLSESIQEVSKDKGFPFTKLPYLVLRRSIRSMDTEDMIMVSFASQAMRRTVGICSLPVGRFNICFDSTISLGIYTTEKDVDKIEIGNLSERNREKELKTSFGGKSNAFARYVNNNVKSLPNMNYDIQDWVGHFLEIFPCRNLYISALDGEKHYEIDKLWQFINRTDYVRISKQCSKDFARKLLLMPIQTPVLELELNPFETIAEKRYVLSKKMKRLQLGTCTSGFSTLSLEDFSILNVEQLFVFKATLEGTHWNQFMRNWLNGVYAQFKYIKAIVSSYIPPIGLKVLLENLGDCLVPLDDVQKTIEDDFLHADHQYQIDEDEDIIPVLTMFENYQKKRWI